MNIRTLRWGIGACGAMAVACHPPSRDGAPAWPMPNSPSLMLPHPEQLTIDGEEVVDEVTGLVWQRVSSQRSTWADAAAGCSSLVLQGHDDWRLPSRIELVSLVDEAKNPSIDNAAFADTKATYYWSSTPTPHDAHYAFSVYFGTGLTTYGDASLASAQARCVRSGPNLPRLQGSRFLASRDVVEDRAGGLVWQRQSNQGAMSWSQAQMACKNLRLLGLDSWRLPSSKELQTIVKDDTFNPAVDAALFPEAPAEGFWSASFRPDPSTPVTDVALGVQFRNGTVEEQSVAQPQQVRCVRSVPDVTL